MLCLLLPPGLAAAAARGGPRWRRRRPAEDDVRLRTCAGATAGRRGALVLGATALLAAAVAPGVPAQGAGASGSTVEARLLFVGDTGTGDRRARAVRDAIAATVAEAGASHLFLLGDNVYEDGEAQQIAPRFVDLFRPVMRLGVAVHAALGNHDVRRCKGTAARPVPRDASAYLPDRRCWAADHLATPEFGYVDGARYYAVTIPGGAEPLADVFVLDSNTLGEDQTRLETGADDAQLGWLDAALSASTARWRVVALHHPIYSPSRKRFWIFGRRRPDPRLRAQLEPLLVRHGVHIVFQGHQHLYARLRPQRGVRYIVTGGGSRRPDAFEPDDETAPRDDRGRFNHFVYARVTADRFEYCAVDHERAVRDGGWFAAGDAADAAFPAGTCPALE